MMLDQTLRPLVDPVLNKMASMLHEHDVQANQVTFVALITGLLAMILIALGQPLIGLGLFVVNRILDGLDGALARCGQATMAGGYLDIVFDFIVYSGIVFSFALFDSALSLVAAFVIFSFVGTGSSFLAMAIFADRPQVASVTTQSKSFYFLGGLTEGTETLLFIAAICLMPSLFNLFGVIFGLMCWLTTYTRIRQSYDRLVAAESQ
jgi:phosphatidylglycerophosphate synthase